MDIPGVCHTVFKGFLWAFQDMYCLTRLGDVRRSPLDTVSVCHTARCCPEESFGHPRTVSVCHMARTVSVCHAAM